MALKTYFEVKANEPEIPVFKCKFCDRDFDTAKGAVMHMTKAHKEKTDEPVRNESASSQ